LAVSGPTNYSLGFIEGSLGLVSGSLKEESVPHELVAELCSVLRGSHSKDSESPSLERAIMDLLPEIEKESLESYGFFARKARWPEGARFAVCLTHDIDNIDRPIEHIEKVRDRFTVEDYNAWTDGRISLYDNVEEIAKRESELGFRSSFYYMSAEYPLERVRAVAKKLFEKGWDVGLHGDFGTHDSAAEMRKAVARF